MLFKDTHREKHPKIKLQLLQKNTDMDIWIVGTSNSHFLRGSKTGTNYPKQIKQLLAKLSSLSQVHFVVAILFVLTLVSDRAVLDGNDLFLVSVVSTKK